MKDVDWFRMLSTPAKKEREEPGVMALVAFLLFPDDLRIRLWTAGNPCAWSRMMHEH